MDKNDLTVGHGRLDWSGETKQAVAEYLQQNGSLFHLSALIEAIYNKDWSGPGSAQSPNERRQWVIRNVIQEFLSCIASAPNPCCIRVLEDLEAKVKQQRDDAKRDSKKESSSPIYSAIASGGSTAYGDVLALITAAKKERE